ncbi:MAG: NAD(P)/FAD-dependent oxidoreductase [Candidatus Methylomirabilota bacterium]
MLDIRYWDVVIVGAGPAGCVAATLFARQGLQVVLVDKSAGPPPKVCGEYLSPGCLPILERIGVLRTLSEVGARPLRGMLIYTPGGQVLSAMYPPSHHGLAIRRSLLDPILLDVAIKRGAVFLGNFQAGDLEWQGNCVVGIRGRHRGSPAFLRARLIIGADGRNSVVARRLGAVMRHRWLDKLALVGYVAGARRPDDVGEIFLGRDRYCILNPISRDLTNVGLVINRREFDPTTDPTRHLMRAATMFPGLGDRFGSAKPIAPVRCLGPLAYSAQRLTAPGAMLIGDAAGFLDPFTGEGIYAALRSAELAVESALTALLGESGSVPDLLAYGESWRREFLAKWRLCTGLQHAIRHPLLTQGIVAGLARSPKLTSHLMAAVGDLLPAGKLPLGWLLRSSGTRIPRETISPVPPRRAANAPGAGVGTSRSGDRRSRSLGETGGPSGPTSPDSRRP